MNVKHLTAYSYVNGKQFSTPISLILDSALIEAIGEHYNDYKRNYADLHETSPETIFKKNFGFDIWGAVKRTDMYIALGPDDPTVDFDSVNAHNELFGVIPRYLLCDSSFVRPLGTFKPLSDLKNFDGESYGTVNYQTFNNVGFVKYVNDTAVVSHYSMAGATNCCSFDVDPDGTTYVEIMILPDDILLNGSYNPKYDTEGKMITIRAAIYFNNSVTEITRINFTRVEYIGLQTHVKPFFGSIVIPDYEQEDDDIDNPYGDPGTSGPGGGDGDYGDPDEVDPTSVPDLPTASAASTGFITIYNPTNANLTSLGNFLWSNLFDLDTFKKMFSDPMECIISLGIVPCLPNSGGSRNIYFGNIDTGINCTYLSTQYAKVDCGSVNITKYVGSFMDYSPYVKVNLFLPYIGFIHLGTDDIMGGSINVTYHVDVLSGDCIAFITHSSKGVLYSYTGNCLTNVPVTAANYASSLRNYYESVLGIIPSTANGAMSGGAAGAAAGAMSGALSAASNIVLNTKPDFQRSGSLGGSSGIMGVQKPFIIIERPNISVPNKVQHYMGQTSNMTASLGGLSGMTIVEAVHLEGIPCTTSELAEIESILHQGVIL